MDRQDRQGSRTPADLERRYGFGKTFAEILGVAKDAQDAADEAKKAVEGLDQEEIFNRLTNNGKAQGVYRNGENIYINASYINTGKLAGKSVVIDMDAGSMTLNSGGEEIMRVDESGAELAGWNINKDYLGSDEAGINGRADIVGTSEKTGYLSKLRFFTGANDSTERKYATFTGKVTEMGYFQAYVTLNYMAADNLDVMLLSISCATISNGTISLTENDFDANQPFQVVKMSANTLMAWGKISEQSQYFERLKNGILTAQISFNSCIPAFQVLEDGTLLSKYAYFPNGVTYERIWENFVAPSGTSISTRIFGVVEKNVLTRTFRIKGNLYVLGGQSNANEYVVWNMSRILANLGYLSSEWTSYDKLSDLYGIWYGGTDTWGSGYSAEMDFNTTSGVVRFVTATANAATPWSLPILGGANGAYYSFEIVGRYS